ncbi:hypothetical protein niasHT_014185 [Heterodera trifolii]|uniref:Effector protein n=1 Tax=Heterodera trifolii TaxID=157864 RepID=A0ABD2KX07_9BILA
MFAAAHLFLFLITHLLLIGAVVGNDQPIAPSLIEKLRNFLSNMLDTVIQIEEANSPQLIVNNEQQRFGFNDLINAPLTVDQHQPAQQQHIAQFGPSAPPLSDDAQFGPSAPPLMETIKANVKTLEAYNNEFRFEQAFQAENENCKSKKSFAKFDKEIFPKNFKGFKKIIIGCDVDMEKLEHICNTIQTFEVLKCLASVEKQKHYAKNLNKYLPTQTNSESLEKRVLEPISSWDGSDQPNYPSSSHTHNGYNGSQYPSFGEPFFERIMD